MAQDFPGLEVEQKSEEFEDSILRFLQKVRQSGNLKAMFYSTQKN